MKLRYLSILAAIGFLATSCATQTASRGSSTDDIYYSSGDVTASTVTTETTTKTTTSSESYSTYPGNSEKVEYNTPSTNDNEYRSGSEDLSSESYYDEDGNTYIVNNYYEDDNYGYDDYHYTSNIYRYYYPYSGFGYYSYCYTPYYYNPYHSGWNVGFGYCCYPYNSGYYGYYNPYYNPYYGYGYGGYYGGYYGNYGGYYGGYGGYNNGYYNGYNNGYYDGYYGSGYGGYNDYNGYNGYSDNGHYYGPNTSTGSNTNTGSNSADNLAAGYDKAQNTDLNHVLTDKGALEVHKGDVNTNAASAENGTNLGSPEYTTIKGVATKSDVSDLNNAVSEINSNAINGVDGVGKEAGSVKVIKYYNASDAPVKNNISTHVGSPEVKSDRGVIRTNDNNYNVSKPSAVKSDPRSDNNYKPDGGGAVKAGGDAPVQKQNYQQQNTNNGNQARPQYDNNYNKTENKTIYNQPSNPDPKPSIKYDQPKKNTYEAPKSNSSSPSRNTNVGSSGKSSGSYSSGSSSGSSNRSSSGSSGSSGKKRSGGK